MRQISRAFTLVELLVVMAIIGLICAILFPVFSAAKGSAERVSCMGNLRSLVTGAQLYVSDYDDRLMPVNQAPADAFNQSANSRVDRTWVQNLLPYVTSFAAFRCPADHTPRPSLEASFDQDLVPGDTDSQYYTASLRSNYGYNFQNLAPIVMENGEWTAEPKTRAEITDESSTLLFADSVWAQTENGDPTGGGNWLVTPPCRYYSGSTHVDSFTGHAAGRVPIFTTSIGWNSGPKAVAEIDPAGLGGNLSIASYGNVWPWHSLHVNIAMIDGSVHSITTAQLSAGCNEEDAWKGLIYDPVAYIWDVN